MSRSFVFSAVVLCLALPAGSGVAQKMYFTAHAGYGFGSGTQMITTNMTGSTFGGEYGSYGEGFRAGASGQYMFNDNIGAELDVSYWAGKTFDGSGAFTQLSSSSRGSGLAFTPAIVISSGLPVVTPYAKAGIVLGVLKVTNEEKYTEFFNTWEISTDEKGGLAVGYTGSIGVLFSVGSTVDLFVEATAQSVTYTPSKMDYVRYVVNGESRLEQLPHKTLDYEDSLPINSDSAALAPREPFSSIGLTLGVRIGI